MSLDLIKNRPVFDISNIEIGSAIKIKNNISCYPSERSWRDALVTDASYTDLTVAIYNKAEQNIKTIEICLNEVLDKAYEIKTCAID